MVLPQSCGNFYGKSRLSAEKRQLYFLWFSERSRHLIGTDVKEILEIPCQCWILQNSFSFLITRRSRGSNPVSATKSKAVHMDCFFRCHRVMSPKKRGKNPISLANVASRLTHRRFTEILKICRGNTGKFTGFYFQEIVLNNF